MKIMITASFDDAQSAGLAISTLGMIRGGHPGMQVSSSGPAASGASALLNRASQDDPWGCHLIQVRCGEEQETSVVGELAALGARKISVTSQEEV